MRIDVPASGIQVADSSYEGLSEQAAIERLAQGGLNELPSKSSRNFLQTLFDVLREPMLLLLLGIAVVYAVLGDRTESITMGGAVLVVLGLTIVQERRTENAMSALRELSTPRAHVLRGGVARFVERSQVVIGDLVILSEGERVPADGVVVRAANLNIDESALTGESVPVTKRIGSPTEEMSRPGGEESPFVYAGTLVVGGHGRAVVKRTGIRTEIGAIGASLEGMDVRTSPLHRQSRRLVFILATIGAGLCLLAILIYGARTGQWIDGVLVGLTMAISIVPEEIPVVFTILMALGAWRIAKSHVLTRRLPAIETLGSATTLCVDKTGTLTQNKMAVAKIVVEGQAFEDWRSAAEVPASVQRLIRYAVLASQPIATDPMEKAIWQISRDLAGTSGQSAAADDLVGEFGLAPDLLAVSFLWKQKDDDRIIVATKGAPEAVGVLCGLNAGQIQAMREDAQALAGQGLRVLAVAGGEWGEPDLPTDHRQLTPEFIGLVGLADPVRSGVKEAISECRQAGIRVVMITGDLPATASNIAKQIGLDSPAEVITGSELSNLPEGDLRERVRNCSVFARIMPEQKLLLVQALQANGEVVAMTGDGVNDAPALRAADIGIAMGGRGTDVAREAADLILLDDDFSSIVKAIRQGRKVFDNLRHAIAYIVAVHVPIGGLTILPVLFGMPLMLLPLHIVLLEMTVDPACATVFEAQAEEADVMARPPRSKSAGLIERPGLRKSLSEGAAVLVVTLGSFVFAVRSGDVNYARTIGFGVLIVANLSLITMSTAGPRRIIDVVRQPSRSLAAVVLGALVGLAMLVGFPALRVRAHFSAITALDAVIILALGTGSVMWLEAVKSFQLRRQRRLGTIIT